MPSDFDPATDFPDVVDRLEAVTVADVSAATNTPVASALRRAVTTREAAASEGKYTESDVVWHLPASLLTSPPAVGDTITDAAATVWTILEVQQAAADSRWRCVARVAAIDGGFNETIDIQLATWNKGSAGAATPAWANVQTGLSARIQPHRMDIRAEHGRRTVRTTHRIYVSQQVSVNENHRIKDGGGGVYHVVASEKSDRIDALMVIHVVQTPWPVG
ncbi:MAG: head-tail adaptor protein [Planctomycetes bacterium]|nr:head-tail adaptor protein [Planctomycetota bacterium]